MISASSGRDFLVGGGTCGELIRELDWASTPIGPIETWSASLRSMVANLLHARQPMLLFWGPELIQFYNDSFVPSFGRGKHPAALGQRAAECWADAWPVVGAQIDAVMSRGEPAWHENALVPIFRNGRMEEVFWTYSYSPAYEDDRVHGTLVIVTEVTARVLAARRLEALSKLGIELSAALSHDQVIEALAQVVTSAATDIPFLLATGGLQPREIGIAPAAAAIVEQAADAAASGTELCDVALATPVPGRVWPEPVTHIAVRTISGRYTLSFGLSPRLPFDDEYRSFLGQVVEQVASTLRRIDNAKASQEIERQRDNLLMQAPIATALLSGPEHVFQLANPHYCKVVGRNPVGKRFRDAFPELVGIVDIFDRVYATGEPYVANELLVPLVRTPGGPLVNCYFNFNLEPLRSEDGDVYGMMAVAVDITEQVHARHTLERIGEERGKVLEALEDANRTKDEFLAMLGHELRNPLAPIVTALELMNIKDSNATRERAVIERQVRHVIRLVDDLLDISRITRGLITLEKTTVELADVVGAAVQANAQLIEQRGHTIRISTPRGIFVSGDEARLLQIVSNLITNAARYTPTGGDITITLTAEAGFATLRVTDTGVGIEPHMLPKLFDMFVQGPRSPERAEGGLGLGLAIVKNLVALHGGTVTAESAGQGKGSTFTIRLALAEVQPAQAMSTLRSARMGDGKRVLVVDDNEDAANLLAEIARMKGHDVTISHDPHHALDIAGKLAPHVAVLDIGLPGMDGYQLGSKLRKLVPDCRLIALTGYGQAKDRERSAEVGFVGHLVKPVRVDVLLEMLASA